MTNFSDALRSVSTPVTEMSEAQLLRTARRQWTVLDLIEAGVLFGAMLYILPTTQGVLVTMLLIVIRQQHRLSRRIEAVTRLVEPRDATVS
jgi:hypothetical protein